MAVLHSVHQRARTTPRLIAGLVVAALVALGGASAAFAATDPSNPEPSPSVPTPTGTADDITANLDNYGPFVVAGGQSVSATLTLANASVLPVPEVSVQLSITTHSLASRDDLASFYDDPSAASMRVLKDVAAGTPDVDVDDKPLGTGTIGGRGSSQVRVAASAKDLSLPDGTAGVYGVTVTFKVGKASVFVDSMALTWLDRDVTTLPVTAIATIAGQPSRASAMLDGADIDGVTLLVDPTALTSASPVAVLDTHESYLLPATNPDVASLAHAGDTALIEFALDEARSRGWPALTNSPWLALSPVADQSLASWAKDSGATAALFYSTPPETEAPIAEVDRWTPPVSHVVVGDEEQAPLVVPDATLSHLVATFRPTDPAGPSRIVAESALLAFAGDGTQGVVVSPGLDWVVPDGGPSANLAALMTSPWVVQTALSAALTAPRVSDASLPKVAGVMQDVPVDHVDALTDRLDGLNRLAQTADNPDSILVPGGLTLVGAVASSARGYPDLQEAGYVAAINSANTTLSSVTIVQNSDVNLIATSGEVPITIRNDLDVDSTVTVVMRSTSPNLLVRDRPVVTVPAGGEATATIPVEAVSSANVALRVWLSNSDGDPISETQDFTMRVRADWGNAATAVFTGMLVLVMIGGIIRTVRRGRKDTRTGPGEPAEGAKIVDESDD